jgi:HAMP domain-containing protein
VSDIVERLRNWTHAVDAVSASDIMDDAADEIERLRGELAWTARERDSLRHAPDSAL